MSATFIEPIPDTARIYVVWHPEYRAGAELARDIFNWFRLPSGYGIPVFYRSAPEGKKGVPPDVDTAKCRRNLIVLLADEHMVADHGWRHWLGGFFTDDGKPAQGILLYPVALHRTAYNLPEKFRALNFIPLQDSKGRGTELAPVSYQQQKDRLLKQLTEAFARLLIASDAAGEEREKVRIFISHAKADSTEKAKALRDYIYRETQLSAFFDENDIALGSQFANVLNSTLERESAALIALQGDRYASRPWCRREVQMFRKPRQLRETLKRTEQANDLGPEGRTVWLTLPVLLIDAMQGETDTLAIPELGSAPMLRWRDQGEPRYIGMLLRDCILRAFHLQSARKIAAALSDDLQHAGARAIINWTPDPLSISLLSARAKQLNGVRPREIVYPAGRLSGQEIDVFEDLFEKTRFRTYGDLQRPTTK